MIFRFLRDFRIGWRLLVKEPGYSAVVVLGLAVGFATCFLLLGYVAHSLSYDSHVPQREHIYRLMQKWNIASASGHWNDSSRLPARDGVIASGAPVLASAFIERSIDVRVGSQVQKISVTVVDPDFRQIFQPTVLAGDLAVTLARPDTLALTRETATKLFGNIDVVGKTVQVAGQPYRITALLEDQPAATTLPYASLAGSRTTIWKDEYRQLVTTNWGSSHGGVYVKLLPGADQRTVLDSVRRAMLASSFIKRMSPEQIASLNGRDLIDFRLGPL
ncbi:MAG: ABC transporter permease, partial [Lysobacteraceae bacterium]